MASLKEMGGDSPSDQELRKEDSNEIPRVHRMALVEAVSPPEEDGLLDEENFVEGEIMREEDLMVFKYDGDS